MCTQYNRLHATGYLSTEPVVDRGHSPLDLEAIKGRLKAVDMQGGSSFWYSLRKKCLLLNPSVSGFYSKLSSFANYGPMYRRIRQCYLGTGPGGAVEALTELNGRTADIPK